MVKSTSNLQHKMRTPDAPQSIESATARKARAQRSRKLHLGHIAFMRAVVQGLDTYESWNRYLRIEGEHQDKKLVNRTVQWIRDEFAAAARRHDKPGIARLVRIDPHKTAGNPSQLPTLEDYANDNDLAGFSEAEQVEHFIARYGRQSTRQTRRARLIEKQLAALDWLEKLVAEPPKASDPIDVWLHPDLAVRLKSVRIRTLKHLVDRINGLGNKWWRGIPAIGITKADRIVHWLSLHAPSTGLSIGAHTTIPRRRLDQTLLSTIVKPAVAIVPFEKLIIPPELDGSQGTYRLSQVQCKILARNDKEAIISWLHSKSASDQGQHTQSGKGDVATNPMDAMASMPALTHTQRAYWKEAERFMLWAVVKQKKAMSCITAQDCAEYIVFLENPIPAEHWCGPRSRERWSPLWRPFEGPLSPAARRQAVVILKNLYRFLEEKHYLSHNPWCDIRLPQREATAAKFRHFTSEQWAFLEQQLVKLPDTSVHLRLRFALHLFYETGLPLTTALNARVGHLRVGTLNSDDMETTRHRTPTLPAVSKDMGLQKSIVISSSLADELSAYLSSRGLNSDLTHPDNQHVHVLGKATDIDQRAPWAPGHIRYPDLAAGISENTLYLQIKGFLRKCAQAIAARDPDAAARIAAASTQWLRRTHDVKYSGKEVTQGCEQ